MSMTFEQLEKALEIAMKQGARALETSPYNMYETIYEHREFVC